MKRGTHVQEIAVEVESAGERTVEGILGPWEAGSSFAPFFSRSPSTMIQLFTLHDTTLPLIY